MRIATWFVVICLAGSVPAAAQDAIGSIEGLWSRVKSGDTIYVKDAGAQELEGVLVNLADGTLKLTVAGQLRELAATDVRQIARRGDSVWNGTLIGAGVGAALGAMIQPEPCAYEGGSPFPVDSFCGDVSAGQRAAFIGAGAIGYAGIGALIDYFIKGRTVIYRAAPKTTVRVAPVLLPQQRALRVSIGFN